jgi:lambda repressor-like predicted transcriptional regulator
LPASAASGPLLCTRSRRRAPRPGNSAPFSASSTSLRPESGAAITDALSSLRVLTDPRTVRTAARQRERSAFGGSLRRLRVERGLSLRGLASACTRAAKRLRFHTHTPRPYQIVRYESGRLAPHPRTARVIAAALGVPVSELVSVSSLN